MSVKISSSNLYSPLSSLSSFSSSHFLNSLIVHNFKTKCKHLEELYICVDTLELICYEKIFDLPIIFVSENAPYISCSSVFSFFSSSYPSFFFHFPCAFCIKKKKILTSELALKNVEQMYLQWVVKNRKNEEENENKKKEVKQNNHFTFSLPDSIHFCFKFILMYLIWVDDEIYENFTKPIIKNSTPMLLSTLFLLKERSYAKKMCSQHSLTRKEFVIDKLRSVISTLSFCLKDKQFFGGDEPSNLDVVAFSHLSILFSIPIYGDIYELSTSGPGLLSYVKRVNDIFHVWKNHKSFLCGILPSHLPREMKGSFWKKFQTHATKKEKEKDLKEKSSLSSSINFLSYFFSSPSKTFYFFLFSFIFSSSCFILMGKSPLHISFKTPHENEVFEEEEEEDNNH